MTESMTDPQHKGGWTPGELEARPDFRGDDDGVWKVVISDQPNVVTASLCIEDDAYLYAAAPELYEALAEFSSEYDGFLDGDGNPCPILAKARAALAKASPDKSGGA